MSDPVTNAEVEDVLSSIRRLVSEDKRPLQAQPRPMVTDRLVLTPALRVSDHEEDHGAEASESEAQDWSEEDAAFEAAYGDDAKYPQEPTHEQLDADDTADAVEAEKSQIYEDVQDPADFDDRQVADVQSFDDADDDYDDPAHDYGSDPYNFEDDSDDDGEGHLAGLLAAKSGMRDDPEVEEKPSAQDRDVDADAPALQDTKAATLTAKIAALETAIGNIAETWEPDGPGADAYSGTEPPAMAWEDDTEEDQGAAPRLHNLHKAREADAAAASFFKDTEENGQAEDEPEETDNFVFSGDDQVLDEEALRDLVSEIVRSELQGALGERITRNVRKLVRREIHRALTAQELE